MINSNTAIMTITSSEDDVPVIRAVNITKRFPQVLANDRISFDVRKGEIHCLLGENGAGKITLAEILYGFYKPDAGEIYFNDERVNLTSPNDAIQLGIGMVHQHFVLAQPLTVVENVAAARNLRALRCRSAGSDTP